MDGRPVAVRHASEHADLPGGARRNDSSWASYRLGHGFVPASGLDCGLVHHPFFYASESNFSVRDPGTRFGYGGRFLGSIMFLSLRFFWMAVILYATTHVVIVPLLGWTSSSTPWICAVLGTITVFYSSLGGLRAVVLSDVIQTGILLTGALVALMVISLRLGGVGEWWPTGWDPGWMLLRFFDVSSPRTFLMAFIGTGIWYICTAGSDQMAIERYLATRDVTAA